MKTHSLNVDCFFFQIKMPSFFKNFKAKGSHSINSETAVFTNRPFYLSPEHLSREAGPPDDSSGNSQPSNTAPAGELPILEPYSDPKDLISTLGSDSEPYRSEDDQNYMVPFSENGDYPNNNQENQTLSSINTTTVLHNKQRDSLTEHLENGFNGEVYENIPTDIAATDSSNNIASSVNVSSPSITDDSYYETTWGTLTGATCSGTPVISQKSYEPSTKNSDCYENYNNNNRQYARGHSMYENADMLSSVNQIPTSNRFVANEVFTSDEFVSSASASQIPVNDSRPDAEYDVPWTSAAAAAAAQAQATSQKAAAPAPVEPEQNFHRRGPLRSSNSTDEFSAAAAGRRRHKSGDFCNKKGFAGMSTKILFWLNLSVW